SIVLSAGASNHRDPNLLCLPIKWTDIVAFFLGNYVTHAVTALSKPGSGCLDNVWVAVQALPFPAVGAMRGASAILTLAVFASPDLEKAVKAEAVYMVV
ncbi:hypothetical protein K469DRAFT_445772, partial [Zopfia rhizophila CBS 207.26]